MIDLSGKLGPFPVWVYVVGGAGVTAVILYRMKSGGSAASGDQVAMDAGTEPPSQWSPAAFQGAGAGPSSPPIIIIPNGNNGDDAASDPAVPTKPAEPTPTIPTVTVTTPVAPTPAPVVTSAPAAPAPWRSNRTLVQSILDTGKAAVDAAGGDVITSHVNEDAFYMPLWHKTFEDLSPDEIRAATTATRRDFHTGVLRVSPDGRVDTEAYARTVDRAVNDYRGGVRWFG